MSYSVASAGRGAVGPMVANEVFEVGGVLGTT
jgi:hypothetical protein